jgi:D-alanyl-D-alanine carboxypeptidase
MRSRNIFHPFKIGVVLIFIAAMTLPVVSCGTTGMSKDLKDNLGQVVDKAMSKYNIPGAIVGVWTKDRGDLVIAKGKADVETGKAINSNNMVRLCSITKTFTITVLLELVDEGKLGLDDKLSKFDLGVSVPGADQITVRQLCNMTSGLFNYSDDPTFQKKYFEDPNKVWTPEEQVALAITHPPYFPPGQGWHYTNTSITIAGMIITKLTGKDLATELDTRLFKELSLNHTYYPVDTSIKDPHNHGYTAGDKAGELVDVTNKLNPSGMGYGGALISNLPDLKKWVISLANGKFLSKSTQEQRTTLVPGDYDYFGVKCKYGLGIMSSKGYLGHPGDGIGYTNAAFNSPETGTTVVVFLSKSPNENSYKALTLFTEIADVLSQK